MLSRSYSNALDAHECSRTFMVTNECSRTFATPFINILQNRGPLKFRRLHVEAPEIWKFCKISKNNFSTGHFCTTASGFFHSRNWFLLSSELMKTRFFIFLNRFYHVFRTWWISWPLYLENFTLRNKRLIRLIEAAVRICFSKYVLRLY